MIVQLGGRTRAAAATRLGIIARELVSREAARGRSPSTRIHARAARPRLRDMAKATDRLAGEVERAIAAMREPLEAALRVLTKTRENDRNGNTFTNREADDDAATAAELQRLIAAADKMAPDELEAALAKVMRELYKQGVAHAKVELAAPASWEAPSSRAIGALDAYALEFATTVSDDEKAAIKALLRDALHKGVSIKKLTADIAEYMSDGVHRVDRNGETIAIDVKSWARAVARTEVARAQNGGVMAAYAKLDVAEVQWIAAEDERTCPICGALDGTTTRLGANFPGVAVASPPEHVQCRCTVVAVRNTDGTLVRRDAAPSEEVA